MPIYDSKSEAAKTLKGLNLYHFSFSNCSQRVRLALAEKGLSWKSHHLDLTKNEHITEEYQAINPKGVVPTLVNDGEVVIESNDIILYLEEKFPTPALIPDNAAQRSVMEAHIHLCGKSQGAVKVYTYDKLFRQFIKLSDDDFGFLENNRANQDVIQFMDDYRNDGEIWTMRVETAVKDIASFLERLNKSLSKYTWLSGDNFGLADISWVVNFHRLNTTGYPTEEYPELCKWFERITARQSFSDAVLNYQSDIEFT